MIMFIAPMPGMERFQPTPNSFYFIADNTTITCSFVNFSHPGSPVLKEVV